MPPMQKRKNKPEDTMTNQDLKPKTYYILHKPLNPRSRPNWEGKIKSIPEGEIIAEEVFETMGWETRHATQFATKLNTNDPKIHQAIQQGNTRDRKSVV
jgi:hypothetical protein